MHDNDKYIAYIMLRSEDDVKIIDTYRRIARAMLASANLPHESDEDKENN